MLITQSHLLSSSNKMKQNPSKLYIDLWCPLLGTTVHCSLKLYTIKLLHCLICSPKPDFFCFKHLTISCLWVPPSCVLCFESAPLHRVALPTPWEGLPQKHEHSHVIFVGPSHSPATWWCWILQTSCSAVWNSSSATACMIFMLEHLACWPPCRREWFVPPCLAEPFPSAWTVSLLLFT